jgi:hypothetical protein
MVGEGHVPLWQYLSSLQTLAGRAATLPFFAIREPRQTVLYLRSLCSGSLNRELED